MMLTPIASAPWVSSGVAGRCVEFARVTGYTLDEGGSERYVVPAKMAAGHFPPR